MRPRFPRPLPTFLLLSLCGLLLGLCGLPQPWSALTPLVLAPALWLLAGGSGPLGVARRTFWLVSVYFATQLWWLTHFMAELSGLAAGGLLVLPLFALEGLFWALMAALVTLPLQDRLARVWALAAGWVLLEQLRTLGPLAFPWSDLGYTLLPTPLAQTADLWGASGLSLLVAGTAASLVALARRRPHAALCAGALWAAGLGYSLTRVPGDGPQGQALLVRSEFDSFGRANGSLTPGLQFQHLLTLSRSRQPGEITVWSETSVQDPVQLPLVPGAGIYGVYQQPRNTAQSWDGRQAGGVIYDKLKPVPMGEYFPFENSAAGRALWSRVFALIRLSFDPPPIGQSTLPLSLNGVRYGTYICYDSIFSWVTRELVRNGAQVLVNISNDGWYRGWGVTQHFQMGRLRAIETRRWVLRSVNMGVAAAVDDLGRPQQVLDRGEGALHARYRLLSGETPYVRLGDAPALALALGLLLPASRAQRRSQRSKL